MKTNVKLTLVSVVFQGRRKVAFVDGYLTESGKTVVPQSVIDRLFYELCGLTNTRGLTYTVG